MNSVDEVLNRLQTSKFRSGFYLNKKMKKYVKDKGLDIIKNHAYDFVNNRLAPANPINDGKQTPMKGHPVFIAQHACACCCRSCLYKWHKILPGQNLSNNEVDYIVNVIMAWISREFND